MRTFQHILISLLFLYAIANCRRPAKDVIETAGKNPETIEKLDLGLGQLGEVPETLFSFPNLKWLDLRMNDLRSLPENTGDWSNLEYLNIFGNDISDLPPSFEKLAKLKVFFAGTNDFVRIPSELKGLPLQAVYLDQNKIVLDESGIDTIAEIPSLEVLDLARNRTIETFPKNLERLSKHPKLRVIILKETNIKSSELARAKSLLPKVKIEF